MYSSDFAWEKILLVLIKIQLKRNDWDKHFFTEIRNSDESRE
jgi:hypothetical protein